MLRMKWTTGAIGGKLEPVNTVRQAFTSPWRGGTGRNTTRSTGGGAVAGWRRGAVSCDELSPPLSLPLPLPPSSASRLLFCPDSGAAAALPGLAATPGRRSPAPPPSTSSPRDRPAPPRSATPPERGPSRDSSLLTTPAALLSIVTVDLDTTAATAQRSKHGSCNKKKDRSNSKFLHTNSLIKLKRSPPDL